MNIDNNLTDYDTLTAEDMRQVAKKHNENPYGSFPSLQLVLVRFLEKIRTLTSKSGAGGFVIGLATVGHLYPRFVERSFQYDYKAVVKLLEDLGYTLTEIPKSNERCINLGKEIPVLEGFEPKSTFPEKHKIKFYTMIWDENRPIFQEPITSDSNVVVLTTEG